MWFFRARMKRTQAIELLKELGDLGLVQSRLVYVEERKPDSFQLCVKGDYDICKMENFLKKYTLTFEENEKGYLCIFKS
jgi:hypothetical protein